MDTMEERYWGIHEKSGQERRRRHSRRNFQYKEKKMFTLDDLNNVVAFLLEEQGPLTPVEGRTINCHPLEA